MEMGDATDPVDRLLAMARAGDADAEDQLFGLVYGELRQQARALLASRGPQTLQATALVHEVWLKLHGPVVRDGKSNETRNRGTFWPSQPGPCARS